MANFLTKQGLIDLKAEYEALINVKIPKNLETLNAALELGDLRENSERDAALNEQQRYAQRRQEIEEILNDYEIIKEDKKKSVVTKASKVRIGSHVKIEYVDREEIYELKIMGSSEADVLAEVSKVSNESPLAVALLGKSKGSVVEFSVKNKTHKVKIVEILEA